MLYSKEQLHLGLSARRTGGGQRDQGSPVGESPSLEDGPGAGLSYVVRPCIVHCTLARLLDADRMPLCRRSMLGRILESKHISHIDVESASRACDPRRGRARAREALARGRGRLVSWPCSARHRPARKSPEHALCRCTCVNGRVPLGGFNNYVLIL